MSDHRSEPLTWSDKTVLVTGGTGSFSHRCVENPRAEQRPRRIIVFSRDEQKQYEMQQVYPADGSLRYLMEVSATSTGSGTPSSESTSSCTRRR
jgi:FlaA1/EpsC-like NDP-sugar epimerase